MAVYLGREERGRLESSPQHHRFSRRQGSPLPGAHRLHVEAMNASRKEIDGRRLRSLPVHSSFPS